MNITNKSKWRESTWGDEISLEYGKSLRGYDTDSGRCRVYGSNGPIGWTSDYLTTGPGVILGRKGAYRGVEYSTDPFFVIDTAYYVRSLKDHDMRWLYYAIKHHKLGEIDDGSPIPSTTRSAVYITEFPVPPLPEQQAIACILGALDDKIELNRKRNRTLEAMARAIFQSWFVDFDPVKAKATGCKPAGLSKEIAALFPAAFEDSPLGEIPKGWRAGTVGDIVVLSRDAILPGDYPDEMFDHYSIPAFDAGQAPAPETGSTIKSQKFIVTDDCVLVSKLNPKTPRVWIPEIDESRRRIASTEFLVCRPTASSGLGRAFFYCLACDSTFSEHLTSRASGTSNSHQRVRPQDFLSFGIPVPSNELANAFNAKGEPILERILLLKSESRNLATLRDVLLPKLISGELRVPDAERIVGRAV